LRVSLKWLSEYVDLKLSPEDLARRLTLATAEVERIERLGGDWDGDLVRIGRVIGVEQHPNADRLRLATIDLGAERHQVVCGAPNIEVGQKIAFAQVGATVIDGHSGHPSVLKPAKIRGVESAGMVLSEKELGLSASHEGILVLAEDAPVGAPLREFLGDVIFECYVVPNRPDLMGMLGFAREISALTGARVREPDEEYAQAGPPVQKRAAVAIEAPDLCPRYIATVVEDVRVGPSPAWMQERLLAVGMRPINNIVDITNYVMMETGQPLHAFDYDLVKGRQIVVRRAREGELLRTIDGEPRELEPSMLVIADRDEAIAVAGVMGGADSEVTERTSKILLEAACFHPGSIRRASSRLKLRSEASSRFERNIHPEVAAHASARATKLLVEIAGGRAAKGSVDVYPGKRRETRVAVSPGRIKQVLGIDLPQSQVRATLTSLGFTCRWTPPDRYVCRVPYWRTDIAIADDLVEELGRIAGYDQLPATRLRGALPEVSVEPLPELRERLKDALVGIGFQEVITYSLTNEEMLLRVLPKEDLAMEPPLRLLNPMSTEQELLRVSLRQDLLAALERNRRHDSGFVCLFEAGREYHRRDGDLPEEVETICAVIAGRQPDRWGNPAGPEPDFFLAKGYAQALLDEAGVEAQWEPASEHGLLPGRTAQIRADGSVLGVLGQVHPETAMRFDLEEDVFLLELRVPALLPHARSQTTAAPVSRFPAIEQDMAVLVSAETPAGEVEAILRRSRLVADVRLFDVYEGGQVPAGKKSLAYRVRYQAADRTLTDEEAAKARDGQVAQLEHLLGATIRG
jgi:phenylalanyl-tRNA synthetase beta chain